MPCFQLFFRHPDGGWSEIRENNVDGEPHIDGEPIVDGQMYLIKAVEWIVWSDEIGDSTKRFVCTRVVDLTDDVIALY